MLLQMQAVEGNKAHASTSDGAQVIIHLKQPAVDTEYVEFAGTVEAPNQLRETDRAYFGGKFGARMPLQSLSGPCMPPPACPVIGSFFGAAPMSGMHAV